MKQLMINICLRPNQLTTSPHSNTLVNMPIHMYNLRAIESNLPRWIFNLT